MNRFGAATAARFAAGGGEPEDLLRGPFENLLDDLTAITGHGGVVPTGEHHLADEGCAPTTPSTPQDALGGFVELKAPGKGCRPRSVPRP